MTFKFRFIQRTFAFTGLRNLSLSCDHLVDFVFILCGNSYIRIIVVSVSLHSQLVLDRNECAQLFDFQPVFIILKLSISSTSVSIYKPHLHMGYTFKKKMIFKSCYSDFVKRRLSEQKDDETGLCQITSLQSSSEKSKITKILNSEENSKWKVPKEKAKSKTQTHQTNG